MFCSACHNISVIFMIISLFWYAYCCLLTYQHVYLLLIRLYSYYYFIMSGQAARVPRF